jgi:hypothetical protein
MAMDARQEMSVSKASKAFVIFSWQCAPGKTGANQSLKSIADLFVARGHQARKERIKSINCISDLFVARNARQERSVSKVFIISPCHGNG